MTIFAIVKNEINYVKFSCKNPTDNSIVEFKINLTNDNIVKGDSIFKIAAKRLMNELNNVQKVKELSLE